MKEPAVLIDLDGTLANVDERREDLLTNKDWDLFYSKIPNDKLNEWCLRIIQKFKDDHKIILVSGKRNCYRNTTIEWLNRYRVPYDALLLRGDKDYRSDDVVKFEIFETQIKNSFEVLFVIDDRASVVSMWRNQGLVCLQCADGQF